MSERAEFDLVTGVIITIIIIGVVIGAIIVWQSGVIAGFGKDVLKIFNIFS